MLIKKLHLLGQLFPPQNLRRVVVVLAKKLITGSIDTRGATPCLGMYTLGEFDEEAISLGIYHQTENNIG